MDEAVKNFRETVERAALQLSRMSESPSNGSGGAGDEV